MKTSTTTKKPRALDLDLAPVTPAVASIPEPTKKPRALDLDWSGGAPEKTTRARATKKDAKAIVAEITKCAPALAPLEGMAFDVAGGMGNFACAFHPDSPRTWHGQGHLNRAPRDGAELVRAVKADREIGLENLTCADGTPTDAYAIRQKDDAGNFFGPAFQARVSKDWGVIPHIKAVVPPEEVAGGLIPWGAVVVHDGGSIMTQYKMGSIKVNGDGSENEALLTLFSSYKARANRGGLTCKRGVCSNTALHAAMDVSMILTHGKGAEKRLGNWQTAIAEAVKAAENFQAVANRLSAKKMTDSKIDELIATLFPIYEETPELDDAGNPIVVNGQVVMLSGDSERIRTRVKNERDEFRAHVFEAQPGIDLFDNVKSAWSVLNGAASYDLRVRNVRTKDKKGTASASAEAGMKRWSTIVMDYDSTFAAQASTYLYQYVGLAA